MELIRARHDIDAHLLVGRLDESGIETRAIPDRGAPGAWLYGGSNPWAPVKILVRRFQLEEARIVLAEISFEAPSVDELRAQATERRMSFPIVWWVTALVLGVILSILALGQVARSYTACQLPAFCEQSGL